MTIAQLKNDFQATIARQQKQIEALTAGLQKVREQLAAVGPSDGRTWSEQIRNRTNPRWRTCAASGQQSVDAPVIGSKTSRGRLRC